jgi:hypothetical protein
VEGDLFGGVASGLAYAGLRDRLDFTSGRK